jgi:hypothetical protein
MGLDCLGGTAGPRPGEKGNVEIPDGLGEFMVRFEAVVSGKDLVEVDVSIGKNVEPQVIGEIWAVKLRDEVIFGRLEVEKMIGLESQGLRSGSVCM